MRLVMKEKTLLLSGGIDSTLIAINERPSRCLFIDYGQNSAAGELRAARAISKSLGIPFDSFSVDLTSIGAGRLVDKTQADSLWPFRNQALITFAAMAFPKTNVIFLGVRTDDVYPDCTLKFIESMNLLLRMQNAALSVSAPLLEIDFEVALENVSNPSIFNLTLSCHTGNHPCGDCPGCEKAANFRYRLRNSGQPAGHYRRHRLKS
jgi:7-cyano-7-deazaguanine synthase